jgi:cytochrome P450
MGGSDCAAVQLPLSRSNVLDIAPRYRALREEAPLTRVLTPSGQPAWLVTAYKEAREIFADSARFGSFAHPDPAPASSTSDATLQSKPLGGNYFERDIPRLLKEHERHIARLRTLMVPWFAAKRLKHLSARIQELTDGCLDEMAVAHNRNPSQAVNFHDLVGFRLPGLAICALLGVPDGDRDYVIGLSDRMGSTAGAADAMATIAELGKYGARLLAFKRHARGDDVFSYLLAAQEADPNLLSDSDLTRYAMGLLSPGHETTMARMDFGVLYLLSDPSRRDWLMADVDARLDKTIEEILRMTSPHPYLGRPRYALEDVEIGGVSVGRGDLLIVSEGATNRDPSVFEDPDVFKPDRTPNSHIAFGHGPHYCFGQHLARIELRIVFRSLFQRFPDIRLAVDVNELEILDNRVGGGVAAVPVTW